MWTIKRFLITIEAPNWEDFQDVELPRLPEVGETIETKYGTCLVTQTDAVARHLAIRGQDRLPNALASPSGVVTTATVGANRRFLRHSDRFQ